MGWLVVLPLFVLRVSAVPGRVHWNAICEAQIFLLWKWTVMLVWGPVRRPRLFLRQLSRPHRGFVFSFQLPSGKCAADCSGVGRSPPPPPPCKKVHVDKPNSARVNLKVSIFLVARSLNQWNRITSLSFSCILTWTGACFKSAASATG